MKRVRLEVPLGLGEKHLYLKLVGSQTEAFWDKDCTRPVLQTKSFSLEVEIPEEVELIGVTPPSEDVICEKIAENWIWLFHTSWNIPNLKKVLINLDGNMYEVAVLNNLRPDVEDWLSHKENKWWFDMLWGLVIYVTDSKTYGILHWHSKLATPS